MDFKRYMCVIATVYTLLYGVDVMYTLLYGVDVIYNIYRNRNSDDDESESGDELPEHIKRMYV